MQNREGVLVTKMNECHYKERFSLYRQEKSVAVLSYALWFKHSKNEYPSFYSFCCSTTARNFGC